MRSPRCCTRAGMRLSPPTCPAWAAMRRLWRRVTLQGWADFAADLCRSASQKPVILAGHSRGGLVVSQAAETAPDAMDALVYICAMMLPSGMSRAEFKAREGANPAFDGLITPIANGYGTRITGANPEAVFAQLSPPDMAAAAMARLADEPHGPRSTPMRLTPDRWGSLPRTYVECTEDRTIPIASQRLMQAMSPGATVVTLDADHSPFLSRPAELAEALMMKAAT